MYLPAGHRRLAGGRAGDGAGRSSGGDETILVVEDDALVRNYALTQLHSLGYVTLDARECDRRAALARNGQSLSTCCSPTSSCPA